MMVNKPMSSKVSPQTIKLLKTIGSPFYEGEQQLPRRKDETFELYNYACMNKIGLLFLDVLKNRKKLETLGLKSKWKEERRMYEEQTITTIRISELLSSLNVDYVVFKSIMPFLATPNDVDVLFLGSNSEYEKVINILSQSGYKRIEEFPSPSEVMFHDMRVCEHTDVHEKDIYDVDLYKEAGASHIIYLDKMKLAKYQTEISLLGKDVKVLESEVELITIITHSIIPEQLFTLLSYYATLYFLVDNNFNVCRFIQVARENSVTFPVRVHCSLTAILHKAAHGFIPEKIEEVLAELGDETRESKELLKNNFKTPHRYTWPTIIRTLSEKMREGKFRSSFVKQSVSMLNPKLAKFVIGVILERRRRETY